MLRATRKRIDSGSQIASTTAMISGATAPM
jgi:hypothetical protein